MSEAAAAPSAPAVKKKRFELALFALPHGPLGALGVPPIVFLPPYYAAELGIPLAQVSALFLAARMLDIVIDPLLGEWQDRTRARMGRRKLWMAVSTPLLMVAVWLAFIAVGPGVNVAGLALIIFGLYATFAMMLIAHLGWASELRADYHGRTSALGAVQLSAMIGATLILLLPGIVVQSGLGDDADAVHVMGWTVILTLPVGVYFALRFVREPDVQTHEKITLWEAISAIGTNKHLRGVLAPDLLFGIAQGVSGGLFLFYFQYVLGFTTQAQTLLFVYFVSGVIGVPIWMALGRKIGKHRALQAACVYAAIITVFVPFIPHGQFWPGVAMMLVAGLHQGANTLLLRAMLADVVDVDTVKTGRARAGLFNAILLITSKFGLAMGPLTYAVLDVFGFKTALRENNSDQAMAALDGMFIYGVAGIFLLAAASLLLYRLDENTQKALRAEIDGRSGANRAQSQ